jgi:hypothetical protein
MSHIKHKICSQLCSSSARLGVKEARVRDDGAPACERARLVEDNCAHAVRALQCIRALQEKSHPRNNSHAPILHLHQEWLLAACSQNHSPGLPPGLTCTPTEQLHNMNGCQRRAHLSSATNKSQLRSLGVRCTAWTGGTAGEMRTASCVPSNSMKMRDIS